MGNFSQLSCVAKGLYETSMEICRVGCCNGLQVLGTVFRSIHVVRASLIVAVFAALILTLPGQVREVYRIMAEELPIHQIVLALLFLIAATLGIAISANDIAIAMAKNKATSNKRLSQFVLQRLPWGSASLIPLSIGVGLAWAGAEIPTDGDFSPSFLGLHAELRDILNSSKSTIFRLYVGSAICILLTAAVLIVPNMHRQLAGVAEKKLFGSLSGNGNIRIVICATIAGLMSFSLFNSPASFAPLIGSISIILVFVFVLALLANLITAISDRSGIPIVILLIVWVVGLSLLDVNDNHRVTTLKHAGVGSYGSLSGNFVEEAEFLKWLSTRGDLEHYLDRPYPVFIVTAAGGGHYAAEHAATVLARLQDLCPSFSQHIFAISSVSGGSLGSAVFSGLVRNKKFAKNELYKPCIFEKKKEGPIERRVKLFFASDHDFLSPLLTKTLFHDLLQRFLPKPVERLDRSSALDESFNRAWEQTVPEETGYFEKPFLELWDPSDAAPALLLNATDVNSGSRRVIAPFRIENLGDSSPINFFYHAGLLSVTDLLSGTPPQGDVPLNVAVGISARFPFVLPAASFTKTVSVNEDQVQSDDSARSVKIRLVDGGYFENSGAETALDVVSHLKRYFENEPYIQSNLCDGLLESTSADGERGMQQEQIKRLCEVKKVKENHQVLLRAKKLRELCSNLSEGNGLTASDDVKSLCSSDSPKIWGENSCNTKNLKRIMGHLCDRKLINVHVISIGIGESAVSRLNRASELLTPLWTLLNTRERRGHLASQRLKMYLVPCADEWWSESAALGDITCREDKFIPFRLNSDYRLPLGWHLSTGSRSIVDMMSGRPTEASFSPIGQGFTDARSSRDQEYITEAKAGACIVQLVLDGDRTGLKPCAEKE